MRAAVAFALFLASCATVSATPIPDRLRGCWIDRSNVNVTTMRWLPDRERPDVLAGHRLTYRVNGDPVGTRFTLEPSEQGFSFCELEAAGPATRCWRVAEGEGGSLEGGRVFVDSHSERLRITIAGDGPERTVFDGRRDGCD